MRYDPTLRHNFARLGELLHCPSISAFGRVWTGHDDWQHLLMGVTPASRTELVRQLHDPLLVAEPGGAERIQRFRAQPVEAEPTGEDLLEDITDRLLFFGDKQLLARAAKALAMAPSAVRHAILTDVVVLGVGLDSVAWASHARLVDAEGRGRDRLIVLGPDSTIETILHESVHAWYADPSPPNGMRSAISTAGEIGLRMHAEEHEWLHRIDDHVDRGERCADALAWIWSTSAQAEAVA